MRPCAECSEAIPDGAHPLVRTCSVRCRELRKARQQGKLTRCTGCAKEVYRSSGVAAGHLCQPCRRARPEYRDRFAMSQPQEWVCACCEKRCQRPAARGQKPKYCDKCQTRGWISRIRRFKIYERDAWTCWLCESVVDPELVGTRSQWRPSLDHVIPRSHGGSDESENLRLAHQWCNVVRCDGRLYRPEDFRASA